MSSDDERGCASGGLKVADMKAAELQDEILFKQPENNVEIACCASCGIAGDNEFKLKDCTACHLVKYCGVKCQRDHWRRIKRYARSEWRSYVMSFYSSSRKVAV